LIILHFLGAAPDSSEGTKAFYGTTFGMSPERVHAVIEVPLITCDERKASYAKEGQKRPFSFECDGSLLDKALEQRTTYRFARGLVFLDEPMDLVFEFRDQKLVGVTAEFSLGGYSKPKAHGERLAKELEKRLEAAYGPGTFEGSKDVRGAGWRRFKRPGSEAVLWENLEANPPIMSLSVFDAAEKAMREAAAKKRDDTAL
jgi:hypothetical protein